MSSACARSMPRMRTGRGGARASPRRSACPSRSGRSPGIGGGDRKCGRGSPPRSAYAANGGQDLLQHGAQFLLPLNVLVQVRDVGELVQVVPDSRESRTAAISSSLGRAFGTAPRAVSRM